MGKKTRGNGEGSIFKRQKNSKIVWVAEYPLYKKPDGKYKYKTFYGRTREIVKNKLENLISELRTDQYIEKNKITLASIAESIIEDGYRMNKLNDNSYCRKQHTLKEIQTHYIADMEIQKIQEQDIKDFLSYITKYSNSTIGKIYGLVNSSFKRAIKKNIIKFNFLDDKEEFFKPKSQKKDKEVHAFTVDDQKQFINALTSDTAYKYHYQFLLSLYTGMRMGEINALDKDLDIDFENKIIHIRRTLTKDKNDKTVMGDYTKTKNGVRDIIMDSQVEFILKEYLKNEFIPNKENLLFYNPKSTYYSTSQINMTFKRFCEHYEISLSYNVNQHMLRHTFATRCIEAGMPSNVLSKVLGHADIRTTLEIYCDIFANYEKQHANRTYDYLAKNQLLLKQINNDNDIPTEELNKIMKSIKNMYKKQDNKLIKILKLVS